jgi:hypothetical protein
MKRMYLYLLFFIGTQVCIFSQEQPHLSIQFRGRNLISQSYIGLSSLRIKNLTKNCDTTVLDYSNMNLIISGTVGIDKMDKNKADFILSQNYPNPFRESTNVIIFRAYNGPLTLALYDEYGRKLTEYHREFNKGNHHFQISSSGYKNLILTVSDNKNIRSIKIMSAGQGQAPYKIQYIGQSPDIEKRTLKSQEIKQFVFHLGDQLEFTAYSLGYLNKTIVDTPIADSTYIFDMSVCTVPTVTTFPATNITQTTAACSGNVGTESDSAVTAREVSVNPLYRISNYSNADPADDAGPGNFSRAFSNLSPGRAYEIQAYAITGLGSSLGNKLRFSTLSDNTEYPAMADAEDAVKKVYYTMIEGYREASMFSEEYYYIFNLMVGETQYIHPETRYNEFNNFKFDATNELIGELYKELYTMILKANDAQNRLIKMINSGHWSGADLQKLKYMRGEVLFLRGMAYSFLIRPFGEKLPTNPGYSPASMGVPILDTLNTTGIYTEPKRNTCGEVYTRIIKDFSMAETLLPDSWSEAEKGKATKASARGFLGEIYIYLADWTNASSIFDRVIKDGQYSLVDNFQDNFDRFHFHNKESLFESGCDNSVIGVYHGAYSYRLYARQSWGSQKVPTVTIDKFAGKIVINDAALAAGLASKSITVGASQKALIDSLYKVSVPLKGMTFESKEAYLTYIDPLTTINYYKTDGVTYQLGVKIWLDAVVSRDPRLYHTVYTPQVDSYYNFDNFCEKTLRAYTFDYGQKKYIPNDIEVENAESCGFGNNGYMTMNFRILRLDDVYLYYAESEYNKGNITNAFEYLNKVVRRAYGKNGASSSEYDYPVSADFMTVLKKERFKEFCLEGKTWFDVRRWNDAAKEWGARGYTEGKNNALPIPQHEIDLYPGILQNPGY